MTTSDLIQLAENDPAECLDRCRAIIDGDRDATTSASAYRALGIALRSLGRVEESIDALQSARAAYLALGMVTEADESVISQSASVAMSGDFGQALEMLEPLCEASNPAVRAHAQVQFAGLRARTGDFEEALELYSRAEPVLEASEDRRWLALLSSNRGLVYTYSGEFARAEQDIRRAMDLFGQMGRGSSVAEMLGNLGFMLVLKGDIADGLRTLVDAEEAFRRAGLPTETVETARAYGYMLAGLPERAADVLGHTAEALRRSGRELVLAEALVLRARAALAAGDSRTAHVAANEAIELQNMAQREAWRLQAELCRAEAALRSGEVVPTAIEPLGRRLLQLGTFSSAAHAFAIAALTALRAGDMAVAEKVLRETDSIDLAQVDLSVRVLVSVVRAELFLTRHDRSSALGILSSTADQVDENRVLLSATESRAGLSRLTEHLASLGLEAIGRGEPAVEWLERFRGSSLRIAPVVPHRDPQVAAGLAELRQRTKELHEATLAGDAGMEMTGEVRRLESTVRDLALARSDPSVVGESAGLELIQSRLGERQMLYLYDVDDELLAEVVSADGLHSQRIGESSHIRRLARHLLSSMRRAFMLPSGSDPARPLHNLDELGRITLDLDGLSAKSIVVVPPADLFALPWNALAQRTISADVVVSPSASAWYRAERSVRRRGPAAVAVGPRLDHAEHEARAVARVHEDEGSVLSGKEATVEAVTELIGSAATFHGVAHGLLRSDNPMFSSLEFADGDLNLFQLESIEHAPSTVVLSACDSAHGNIVGGQEIYGLTSVFLGRGSRSIVATTAPIPDSDASIAAVERLHRGLREGKDVAAALGSAQQAVDGLDPSLAFVAYGAA